MTNKNIPFVGTYPSPDVPDEIKSSKQYGLLYAKSLFNDWAGKNWENYNDRKNRIELARKYRDGIQPVDGFLDQLNINGDRSYINLNLRPLPIAAKFIDTIIGGEMAVSYDFKATAIDASAKAIKSKERAKLLADVISMPQRQMLAQMQGKELPKPKFEDTEEVELHMNLTFKQAIELLVENGVNTVFALNDKEELRRGILEDIATAYLAGTRTYLDPNYGLRIRKVDPENLVFSFSSSPTLDDIQHAGELKQITIGELRRMFPNEDTDWLAIAKSVAGKNNNPDSWYAKESSFTYGDNYEIQRPYDSFGVTVMDFEFKTTNKIVREKKKNRYGGFSVKKRPSNYKLPKNSIYERELIEKDYEVVYTGYYLIGTDVLLGYKKKENMFRKGSQLSKTKLSFHLYSPNIYKMKSKSLVERMMPFVDEMQLAHLKIQQLVAKARPSGLAIDINGITNINLGDDFEATPLELVKMYDQTGSYLFDSSTDEDASNGKMPFHELRGGISYQEMQSLIMHYNSQLQMLRDMTGINEARDGSRQSSELAVGVQQLQLQSSNNATRFINQAWKSIFTRTADDIVMGLQMLVKYDKEFESYKNALGDMNTETLKSIKDIPLHEFAIFLELDLDEKERDLLEANIQAEIRSGNLKVEDAELIRSTKNKKLAYQLLGMKRRKYEKEKLQMEQQKQQYVAQANIQSSQAAAQMEMQKSQLETQLELQKIQAEYQSKAALLQLEYQLKAGLNSQDNQTKIATAAITSEGKRNNDMMKEDRKDDRVHLQTKDQAKLIDKKEGKDVDLEGENSLITDILNS